jgi:hypothetical protein
MADLVNCPLCKARVHPLDLVAVTRRELSPGYMVHYPEPVVLCMDCDRREADLREAICG